MNAGDSTSEMNFNKKPDDIDILPLMCRIYSMYTSSEGTLLLAEIDKYAA